jgi:hypothetical protein
MRHLTNPLTSTVEDIVAIHESGRYNTPEKIQYLEEVFAERFSADSNLWSEKFKEKFNSQDQSLLQFALNEEGEDFDIGGGAGLATSMDWFKSPGDMFLRMKKQVAFKNKEEEEKKKKQVIEDYTDQLAALEKEMNTAEQQVNREQAIVDADLPTESVDLNEGLYTDDEGNFWQKGRDGNWRVKYVDFVDPDDEFSKEKKFRDWQTLEGEEFDAPHGPSLKPIDENTAGQLLKSVLSDDIKMGGEEEDDREPRAPFELERAGLFEQIGGMSTLVAGLFAKKGLSEAMKEIDIPNTPGLSQAFKRHFYESEQLAKSGMSLAEQQAVQQNIDGAYKQGVENMVRGTSGDRAKFLASLGVLDTQRQSSLLKAAAVNDDIKRKNRGEFQKALFFKEEFEANKSTAERNEELSEAIATKAAYGQMGSNALKTIMDNMTAAKTYGTGSPMDKYMQMQMYNMGMDSSEKKGMLPMMFQGVQDWWKNQRNQSSLVPQQGEEIEITE